MFSWDNKTLIHVKSKANSVNCILVLIYRTRRSSDEGEEQTKRIPCTTGLHPMWPSFDAQVHRAAYDLDLEINLNND